MSAVVSNLQGQNSPVSSVRLQYLTHFAKMRLTLRSFCHWMIKYQASFEKHPKEKGPFQPSDSFSWICTYIFHETTAIVKISFKSLQGRNDCLQNNMIRCPYVQRSICYWLLLYILKTLVSIVGSSKHIIMISSGGRYASFQKG